MANSAPEVKNKILLSTVLCKKKNRDIIMEHNVLMAGLKLHLNKLTETLKYKKVIYVDYPVHHNIGDLLIYVGAIKLLRENGVEIISQFSANNYRLENIKRIIKKHNGNISIVFHGGGNLGDLYSLHQKCRLDILASFPNINTVIFPQTIFYKDEKVLNADAEIFRNHKSLTLFVRDKKSETLGRLLCDDIELCPDTAHMIWEQDSFLDIPKMKGTGILKFRRRDIESDANVEDAFDWDDIVNAGEIQFLNRIRKLMKYDKLSLLNNIIARYWVKHSTKLCVRAAKTFNNYDSIETDRLHGHILCCLIGKSNVVLDNSYGKNSAYFDLWTAESPLGQFK